MEIVVTHLTRMRRGFICAAGVCEAEGREVRPVLEKQNLPVSMLARNGGMFALGRRLSLGTCQQTQCEPPHLEDMVFQPWAVKVLGELDSEKFWALLSSRCAATLKEAFGPELRRVGGRTFGTNPGQGHVSLAYLRATAPPQLYLQDRQDKARQIRISLRFDVPVDLAVTDKRLYVGHAHLPNEALVVRLQEALQRSGEVIAAVGLGRAYPAGDPSAINWLQVNNLYPRECPLWVKVTDLA